MINIKREESDDSGEFSARRSRKINGNDDTGQHHLAADGNLRNQNIVNHRGDDDDDNDELMLGAEVQLTFLAPC